MAYTDREVLAVACVACANLYTDCKGDVESRPCSECRELARRLCERGLTRAFERDSLISGD